MSVRRICTNEACGKKFSTLKRKCVCGSVVEGVSNNHTPVMKCGINLLKDVDVGAKKCEHKPLIRMVESIMLNPNSYKNIESILMEMKIIAEIGKSRQWVFLGCDGPPYCLSERIINREVERFDFAAMVPGLGHLHMNQQKTLFKILDEIMLEPLGKDVLNFISPNAYQFFINAKDTHKSWQAVQVLLLGTTLELIRQYKRDILPEKGSPFEFLEWLSVHENTTLKMLGNIILTYVFAIYLFKLGVRNNDCQLITAARLKFDDLFYAFNHPIYREVEYRDLKNRALYPKEVRVLRDNNMSFSESTVSAKSQGGDFILEGKVKRQKLLAPKGPVKASTWKMIARCLDEFDDIYSVSCERLKLKTCDESKSIDLRSEVSKWQSVLRSSSFLSNENFTNSPKNIYGELLSPDIVNLAENARKKRTNIWKQVEESGDICNLKVDYLRVVPEKDIDNLLYVESYEED